MHLDFPGKNGHLSENLMKIQVQGYREVIRPMRWRLWSLFARHRLIFAFQGIKIQVIPNISEMGIAIHPKQICGRSHVKMASRGRSHIVF